MEQAFIQRFWMKEVFNKASEEKQRRAVKLKRTDRIKVATKEPACYNFVMGKAKEKYDDPFAQASYLYGLIRNEVVCNGSK